MKLDEGIAFQELTNLMEKIGAPNVIWTPSKSEHVEIPITIEDISSKSHPDIVADLFAYPESLIGVHGRQCLLYIPFGVIGSTSNELPKFHLKECRTIRDMKEKGRFERYTVTNRTSGVFPVNMKENRFSNHYIEKQEVRLNVCKNCLKELELSGYNATNFDIKSFFEKYKSNFANLPPTYDGISEDIYTKNWENISTSYRIQINWRCEICNIDLSGYKNLLHVHHRNAVKRDTNTENLIALCKLCHSEQFQHEHMEITPEEKAVILRLRKQNSELENIFRNL